VAVARPTAANILARLESAGEQPTSPGASRLAQANKAESRRLARDYAEAVEQAQRDENRAALFEVATQSFESITSPLVAAVEADAPLAKIDRPGERAVIVFVAVLSNGRLAVSRPIQTEPWDGPFTVIAHAAVMVEQSQNRSGYEGRSHSLWFCDAQEEGHFAWYETAFMNGGFSSTTSPVTPYNLDPRAASVALNNVMGSTQLAWPFEELDRADPSEFVDRWIGWFADAASGTLEYPPSMPEKPTADSYRRE
jgi:serine/threonine-protein kinase